MKHSKSTIHSKVHKVLIPQFEDQQLTSFAGLIIFQALFQRINLKNRLRQCFKHQPTRQFGFAHIVFVLIIHLLLGFRRLRDIDYYSDDPIVKRVVGVDILPSVSTISRSLSEMDDHSVTLLQSLASELVLSRLQTEQLPRVTLDFDGTVQGTKSHAEGTAVGYNKKKKGNRSYYTLLCTVAQTAQVLDMHHRPGNVHDSNGANDFIKSCVIRAKQYSKGATIESRTDSAFFDKKLLALQESLGVEYTNSVPFARFVELKERVEQRKRWHRLDDQISYFECFWKAKSWDKSRRFIFIRTRVRKQNKEPVQLDLFEPYEHGYEFKAIVTNKKTSVKNVLAFHNGRGAQEAIIGDLKTHCQQDYVPVKTLNGNKSYLLAGILAHNLAKELQMDAFEEDRNTTNKRPPRWIFSKLETLRRNIIQRAGRLTRPNGKLTLTMSANDTVKKEIMHYLEREKLVA
jgi:hypothetical protein